MAKLIVPSIEGLRDNSFLYQTLKSLLASLSQMSADLEAAQADIKDLQDRVKALEGS